jgi:3-keto-5-aminohexanoate cleavage enzyme
MAATPANLVALVARIPEGSVWQAIGIGRGNLSTTTNGSRWAETPGPEWRTR